MTRPQGYKAFFMLSTADIKIYAAYKCYFNIYEQDKFNTGFGDLNMEFLFIWDIFIF